MTTSTSVPPTDGAVPPPVAEPTGPRLSGARVALAIVALALGSFAIGTTEFVTMGLLPDIARGIDESIPTTGHIITAYALGVVVGAPLIVSLGARLPRRELAVALMVAVALGSAATALASGYLPVMLARFVAGLPHGAYFGVASLIAASLVRPEAQGRAISGVMVGLSVGTVAGVPASTWLGQEVGWRSAYWMVVGVGVLAALLVLLAVPHTPGDRTATVRRELAALRRPPVLFAFGTGMIGFGGIFAMYSYVAPLLTDETGLAKSAVPWFLFVFGVGSVLGSWLGGTLADWNIERSVVGGFLVSVAALALVVPLAGSPVAVGVIVFTVGLLGSVLAITLQVRLMQSAGDAQMLGAALNHSALNIANGLGALLGAVVIDAGYGYRAPSIVGAGLATAGLVLFLVSLAAQRRTASAGAAAV